MKPLPLELREKVVKAYNPGNIKSGCTVLGIVGVRAQVVAARLPPMKES
jgi:hypothetical protein